MPALTGRRKPLASRRRPAPKVICANKSVTLFRPRTPRPDQAYGVWCYIALSIAQDRDRAADLLIEDAGAWTANDSAAELERFVEAHRKAVVWSIVACGQDQSVVYERTYISFATTIMPPGCVGTALTVAPYVVLARRAVPPGGFAALNRMTLSEWERAVGC